jgi:hypothetical protein
MAIPMPKRHPAFYFFIQEVQDSRHKETKGQGHKVIREEPGINRIINLINLCKIQDTSCRDR